MLREVSDGPLKDGGVTQADSDKKWHALACAGQPERLGTRVLGSSLAVPGVRLLVVGGRKV